ncbi:TetR/AcrR family transcriptional regulator C-terminal domain-containing protein [Nocardia goodfellowii]|uniref:DNA-binding transcriptional regulator YhcF (GntR family) n=1 Tax=Nocardia goodfellowii TaxID=882446 RepID=A0ABS4QGH6_9NOCA|nr:TetR/AcrR family transcriptional regulator C-terminal domain-containing protein [Nocardia goodfellowii]MBP2190807.1 DNA-binding transcriptional regulator YhcF (GntR family) [Nocardia goodfellowii]
MSPSERPTSPYLVISEEIRARIMSGQLRPGDRVPSIRQIVQRWGVAVATATRVTATLRDEGLVETKVGSGTVVSMPGNRKRTAAATPNSGRVSAREHVSQRKQLLRKAIEIADAEGLDAVSMRRLAVALDTAPMSLYRHVANKDELLIRMADEAFGELELAEPGARGWRADLELNARAHWQLCRRHLWLPRTVSFTRPLLAPNMMAQTEWVLRALDGLGLPTAVRIREALTLHALVLTMALSAAEEIETEQNTGISYDGWQLAQLSRARELLDSGRFPFLADISDDLAVDLDELFEYSLGRHLDGFAVLVARTARKDA